MTRTFNTLAVAALTLTLAAPLAYLQSSQGAPKIAYINSAKIMAQTPGRTELDAYVQKEMAPFEAKLKAMQDSNTALLTKYTNDEPTLTADARVARRKDISDKQRVWQQKSDSINLKASDRKAEIELPMITALKKILNDIRAEDGLWMIIDVSHDAVESGLVVAIDRNMEITDRVLDRFKIAVAALPKPGAPASGSPLNTGPGVGVKIPPPPPPGL